MTQFGWHFLGKMLRNGEPIPKDGVWLPALKSPLIICKHCYHGSKEPWDALTYAPGALLTYCEYKGEFVEQEDKFGASQRRIIKRMDVTELLYYFARMQALSVIPLWDAPDVVLDYLMTGDNSIRSAARSAAGSAARSAAENAAWSAAWSAARSAAWSAARSAARSAAENARNARNAAENARSAAENARNAARQDFNALVYECFDV